VQPAYQIVEFGDGLLRLAVRFPDHLAGLVRQIGERGPGQPQIDREGDQPLLGAVVQIAFDAAALGIDGFDQVRAALCQMLDTLLKLLSPAGTEQRERDSGLARATAPATQGAAHRSTTPPMA
jgi:hypothetical protein